VATTEEIIMEESTAHVTPRASVHLSIIELSSADKMQEDIEDSML